MPAPLGRTQADRVIPLVRSRSAASATVTQSLTPSKESAPPVWPPVDQTAPLIVPVCPFPVTSANDAPLPPSNEYAATRPGVGGGPDPGANVAVYVVGEAGATSTCVCAPPSDQDEKAYDVPPTSCGETALTEFADPMMTVRVNGAVPAALPTTSSSAVGVVAKVRSTVWG